ncbi:hypothetical protein ANN_14081 [Periplaneta americana]|uniref:Uncharacterized protein n=1 Tax=Periplaneta americana TaxID=6978 RepID=A0ABQ8SWT1_PERAM|nr:hypothetical protein ANN_14081 [Periplaneta americana]
MAAAAENAVRYHNFFSVYLCHLSLLRRNCLLKDTLKGMMNERRVRGRRRYQMIDDIKIYGLYTETKKKAENSSTVTFQFIVLTGYQRITSDTRTHEDSAKNRGAIVQITSGISLTGQNHLSYRYNKSPDIYSIRIMMIERKQTLVITFTEHDIPRPEPYLLHEWIYEDLRLMEEQLEMIELNGVARQIFIKCISTDIVEEILERTKDELSFTFSNGQRTKVKIEKAEPGIKSVKIYNLPPELSNINIIYR